MRITIILSIVISLFTYNNSRAQDGNWEVYMAQYEEGPGSIMLNMDLIHNVPKTTLPFRLVTGVNFANCSDEGMPNADEFEKLYVLSDQVESLIKTMGAYEYVGTFTYQCERLDYIYLADTLNIRSKLEELYQSEFEDYEYYIGLTYDAEWEAYTQFLYPNDVMLEYMTNQKVIFQLQQNGDNLSKARQVDHWLYFEKASDRNQFIKEVKALGFNIENQVQSEKSQQPYQVQISRTDFVNSESINQITFKLTSIAKTLHGNYDGWETIVITE